MPKWIPLSFRRRLVRTPVVLQAQVTDCGLAALAMLLGYHGAHVFLDEMRQAAGSTRGGTSLLKLMEIAKQYGFTARLFRVEVDDIMTVGLPVIAYYRFVHFIVVEGIVGDEVVVNDPCIGPDRIPIERFDGDFTGLILSISPSSNPTLKGRAFSLLRWILVRLDRLDPIFAAAVLLTFAASAGFLTFTWLTGNYVDQIVAKQANWVGFFYVSVTAALTCLAIWVRNLAAVETASRLARDVATASLNRLSQLSAHFFSERLPSQIIGKLSASKEISRQGRTLAIGFDLLYVVSACVLALYIGLGLGSILCICVLLEVAAIASAWLQRGVALPSDVASPLAHIGFGAETLQEMEPFHVSGRESELFSRLSGLHADASNPSMTAMVRRIRVDMVRRFIALGGLGLIFIAGLSDIGQGRLSLGKLSSLLILSLFTDFVLQRLARLGNFRELQTAVHQLADLEAAQPLLATERVAPLSAGAKVLLDNVAWRPSDREPYLFHQLSSILAAGTQLGVTGNSQSGKSVLAQLLCGFLLPSAGTITIFENHRAMPIEMAAVLLTSPGPIIAGTVRGNLLCGALIDDSQLSEALADVGLEVELQSRGGLMLELGEGGCELSGGQQRRLQIARALLRSPGLLVIDGMLDGVDLRLENLIRDAIRRRGITLVLTTRRRESMARSDAVINLDDYAFSI
jgi:ABC-type bacteriocin/lantibiotic exporter with double-glycine peptidase domain